MKDLGTKIAGRRKALGLTQTAMAERLSVRVFSPVWDRQCRDETAVPLLFRGS